VIGSNWPEIFLDYQKRLWSYLEYSQSEGTRVDSAAMFAA
jgi:hypothetical protein